MYLDTETEMTEINLWHIGLFVIWLLYVTKNE